MKLLPFSLSILLLAPLFALTQVEETPVVINTTSSQMTGLETVNGALDRLYEVISFEGGAECDWKAMDELFLPGAILIMPTGPGGARKAQTLAEFQQGFRSFIANSPAKEKGFHEFNHKRSIVEFGDVAHAHVVFEARFGKEGKRILSTGIDSIQLVRIKDQWHVASVATENVRPDLPLPKQFQGK
ncbi:MAG: hypothetical protein P1V35_04635 [Planctomycetota bacterium]|nr:hypothetical protein [Planctomycetota bacterium]